VKNACKNVRLPDARRVQQGVTRRKQKAAGPIPGYPQPEPKALGDLQKPEKRRRSCRR
jgi:hypothetical protein